jgi:hypothetical protein
MLFGVTRLFLETFKILLELSSCVSDWEKLAKYQTKKDQNLYK